MSPGRVGLILLTSALTTSLAAAPARAGDDAAGYHQKATSAFALGHFADAAENFEKAFAIHADPALLYNAAQAHRLAGNKERALLLYENYLRVYGKREERAAEVQQHIDQLRQAIAQDRAVATSPPTAPAAVAPAAVAPASPTREKTAPPPAASAPPPLPAAPPPPAPSAAPVLVAQPAPPASPSQEGSLTGKPWFWALVGGGVVAAVVAIVLVSRIALDPVPTLGKVDGN